MYLAKIMLSTILFIMVVWFVVWLVTVCAYQELIHIIKRKSK